MESLFGNIVNNKKSIYDSFEKSYVKQYEKKIKSGKLIQVKGYENKKKNKISNVEKCAIFVIKYFELHNEASKEYKEAFKKIGTKMWGADYAHIKKNIPNKENLKKELIKNPKMIGYYKTISKIVRPLTVLDSYSNISRKNREWLDKEIDSIWKKYKNKLEKYNKEIN